MMQLSCGKPGFPIWLMGDSPPEKGAEKLKTPLDPRHPARHNIWTPVLNVIQDTVYLHGDGSRLDTSNIYIRNARSPKSQPDAEAQEVLGNLFQTYKPNLVLTFGARAFKICVAANGETLKRTANTAKRLGKEFSQRVDQYEHGEINIVPLLHVSIARKYYYKSHGLFVTGKEDTQSNYFNHVGIKLANLLLDYFRDDQSIWMKPLKTS